MSVPTQSEHDLVVCGGCDRGQGEGGHIRPCDRTACHWYGSVVVSLVEQYAPPEDNSHHEH